MDDLKKALKIRAKYNEMPFNKFIKKFENYFKIKLTEEDKKAWRFVGLNNVDLFLAHTGKIGISCINIKKK